MLETKYYQDNLTSLPDTGFTGVEYLDFTQNQFTKVDFANHDIKALKVLDISYNKAGLELHLNGGQCPDLAHLYLYKSNLKELHLTGSFPELCTLHLAENQLINFEFPNAPKLKTLYLYGNDKLQNVPLELIGKERENVVEQLRNISSIAKKGGYNFNDRVKVILFGNGEAGKSTLLKQFVTGHFDPNYERTKGIFIQNKEIPIQKDLETIYQNAKNSFDGKGQYKIEIPESLTLGFWDFGGQEYYHATHRLFLTNNTIYLIVFETATNQFDEKGNYEVSYWENNIRNYAPTHKILYIHNKVKKGETILKDDTERFALPYVDNNEENNRVYQEQKWGVGDIEKAILRQIPTLSGFPQLIPTLYDNLWDALSGLKKEKISVLDLMEIAKDYFEAEQLASQCKTFIELYHERGSLIFYQSAVEKKSSQWSGKIFLNPAHITQLIYLVLNEKVLLKCGEFNEDHVEEMLRHAKNVGNVSTRDCIGIMLEFGLVLQINENNYIATQYLPDNEKSLFHLLNHPELSEDQKNEYKEKVLAQLKEKQHKIDKHIANLEITHTFTLRFPTFLPSSLFLRFLAKEAKDASEAIYTRDQILYKGEDVWIYTTVIQSQDERKIVVAIQDKNEVQMSRVYVALKELADTHNIEFSIDGLNFISVSMVSGIERLESGFNTLAILEGKFFPVIHKPVFLFFDTKDKKLSGRDYGKIHPILDRYVEWLPSENGTENEFIEKLSDNIEILHFVGHCEPEQGLLFNQIEEHQVDKLGLGGERMSVIFKSQNCEPKLIFLNACNSDSLATKIIDIAEFLITVNGITYDQEGIDFSTRFYKNYVLSKDIEQAFRQARLTSNVALKMKLYKSGNDITPKN